MWTFLLNLPHVVPYIEIENLDKHYKLRHYSSLMPVFFETKGNRNLKIELFLFDAWGSTKLTGESRPIQNPSTSYFFHNQESQIFKKFMVLKRMDLNWKLEIKWLYHNKSCRKSSNNLIFSDIFHSPFWLLLSPTRPLFRVIASDCTFWICWSLLIRVANNI